MDQSNPKKSQGLDWSSSRKEQRSHARVKGKFNDAVDAAYRVMRLEKDGLLNLEWKVKLKDGE